MMGKLVSGMLNDWQDSNRYHVLVLLETIENALSGVLNHLVRTCSF